MSFRTIRFLVLFITFILLTNNNLKAQQFKSEKELRTEADRLFEDEDYSKAYNLFAQLVALYPKDPELNYKLGVCMLYSEPDKKKCFSYLKLAAASPKDAPKDALFYYAKAFHINYLFDEAIRYYKEYKSVGSASQQKKLHVDNEINACVNGKRLLATMSELIVMNKKQLNEGDYFRSYDLSTIGGKLLVKPDVFRTNYDKRKKEKSVVYIPKSGDQIYFSSLGENGETGRDIYYATKVSGDKFSKPVKLPVINTEYDEDYPFLHPDGKTLYFSSKGFNSMGGYDIFKSVYNEATNTWSQPVNLEFPINSPDDDYLFVTDSSEKFAYFSTGRQSPPGKIDVLKVKTERVPMTIAFIKGTVLKEDAKQSLKSKITVKDMESGKVVGVFQAKDNGDYSMEVPNGGKLLYTVETPGIPIQSDKVILPMATSFAPFKQSITYENKVLKIINYFDSPPDDNSYLQYLELIEKKAKLNVNENDVKVPTVSEPLATNPKENAVTTNNPTITPPENNVKTEKTDNVTIASANTVTTATKPNYSNDQLINIAKEDAQEATVEAAKIKQDAADAYELSEQKKIEADKLDKQAEDAQSYVTSLTDPVKKENAQLEATKIKNDAEEAKEVATTLNNLAKSLEADATLKQKEADINEQYVKELENVAKNKNNKDALAKITELQKQLEDISNQKKQSDIAYANIKSVYDQKQNEITKAEAKSTSIKKEISDIDKEISINEAEINNSKDKSLKKALTSQVNELKLDKEKKQSDLAANQKAIEALKIEAKASETEMYLVNQIKTTDSKTAVPVAINTNTTATTNTLATTSTPIKSEAEKLTDKYNQKLLDTPDTQTKETLQSTNVILSDYNKELTNLIVADNNKLNTTKSEAEKAKIKKEIAQLQSEKNKNAQAITANNAKIKELETPIAVATNTTSTETPITTNTTVAVTNPSATNVPVSLAFDGKDDLNKLTNLKTNINNTTNPAFEFQGYKEPSSVNLKKDADAKLELTKTSKTNLEETIAKAEESIKANTNITSSPNESKDVLYNEGDALANKAKDSRNLANAKSGSEKDNLLAEAKEYDRQANQKYLQASDIVKKQNKNNIDINNQNLTELINQSLYLNKNSAENTANLNQAQKLQGEANNYLKQAIAIRDEANSLSSDAAKLGTISNAEEKEAEAIAKQDQAIKVLLKSNPGYTLKKSESTVDNPNAAALNSVKQQFDKLNKEKLDAYMALSKANQNEYKAQNAKLSSNPAIKNNTNKESVALKKQAEDLNKQAVTLISKALTEQNAEAKQNLLLEANKNEVEALTLLTKANEELVSPTVAINTEKPITNDKPETNEPVANNTNTKEQPVSTATTAVENTNEPIANNNNTKEQPVSTATTAVENTNEPVANNNNTKEQPVSTATTAVETINEPVANNNVKEEPVTNANVSENNNTEKPENVTKTTTEPKNNGGGNNEAVKTPTNNNVVKNNNQPYTTASTTTINPEYKQIKDPEVKSVISFIDENPVAYKNTEATSLKSTSINNLITLSEEQAKVEDEIKTVPGSQTGSQETIVNIEKLNTEADNYDNQASAKRKEAADKTGVEKEQLVAEIKELETKSFGIKVKASNLQQELNNATYTNYKKAIENYLSKAKDAGAEEVAKAEEMISQISIAKKQSDNLRDEATNITNNAAKLGAYSNAEEKEAELMAKQTEVIKMLRNYDIAYKADPIVVKSKPEDNMSPELKQKYDVVLQKQNAELENITKANVMEYETVYEQLPVVLSSTQNDNKTLAQNLITESKKLSDKANQTNDAKQKKELLTQASKKGQEAIVALNKTFDKGLLAKNTTKPSKNTTKPVKEKPVKVVKEKPVKETSEPVATTKTKEPKYTSGNNSVNLTVKGLEVKTGNAYSKSNPIPLDQKIPDGLIFRVQVGAFKSPIPSNTFKGLTPVNAQTTGNGFIRYTVGNFENFEDATGVKNDLRGLGYSDAFIVVFYNGERITMNEAINKLQKDGKAVDASGNQSAGITANANLPKNIAPPIPKNENLIVTKELEKINGLLFTVQIGVYSREITRSQLWKLEPIYTEKLPTGLFRYTAGIYNDRDKVIADKRRVVDLGIKDAFVSAYYNGKRIPFTEAEKIKTEDVNLKMEPENPIVFPGEQTSSTNSGANTTPSEPKPTVAPFKNNVTAAPAPTPENGVKLDEDGVTFKVQIGAYRNQVPQEVADKFLSIKTWPVDAKFVNGLYIYTVGSFSDAKFAKQLRDEVVSLGVTDAFISVYQNGKKLYGQEAANYLNR